MNKSTKIFSIVIIVIISFLWIFLQLLFGMVSDLDRSSSDINKTVAVEWILLTFLVSLLIYIGYSKKLISIYFSLVTANIFFTLVMCLKSPIFLRNLGFHHSSYVPVLNPLLFPTTIYAFFLAYINFRFRQKKLISQNFSRIIYIVCLIALAIIVYITKSSKGEMEKILHFQG
jgi:hypothetical protein